MVKHTINDISEKLQGIAQKMMSTGPAVMYVAEAAGQCGATFITGNVKQQLGYEPEAFVDNPAFWFEHIHPADQPQIEASISDLYRNGHLVLEYRFLHKDGNYRWMRDELTLLRSDSGEPVEIIGYWIDITEQKKAEAREARFGRILNSSWNEIYVFSAEDLNFIEVNAGAQRNLGYTESELKQLTPLDLKPAFTRDSFDQLLEPLWQGEKEQVMFETYHRRKDGTTYPIEVRVQLFRTEELPLYAAVILDITERKSAEQRLNAAEAEANQRQSELAHLTRVSTMGEMATTLAHELNQPLYAIETYSQTVLSMLRNNCVVAATATDALQQISAQAQRASRIIHNIREFVRKTDNQKGAVDFQILAEETIRLIAGNAASHDVRVNLEMSDQLPKVIIDQIEIQQVLLNLINNSIEAMGSEQAVAREVSVRGAVNDQGMVEVCVFDTGAGIDEKIRNKLFEPFYTTRRKGLGLGLSISMSIVEAHGGALWLDKDLPGETSFRFTLPTDGVQS